MSGDTIHGPRHARLPAGASPWRLGFRLLRRLRPREVARWSSRGGQQILVVAPHPDDESIGVGGTLLRHVEAGDSVGIVHVTDGRRSRAGGLGAVEMAERRRVEAEEAAQVLGVDEWRWLGLPEIEWQVEELVAMLSDEMDARRPELLYCPSRVDFHPEHRRVAGAIARTLEGRPASPRVRVYPGQVPLGATLANLVAEVDGVGERLVRALECYRSQWTNLDRGLRSRIHTGARYGAGRLAEELWELDADRFVALHATPEESWPDVFRGIRYGPWTDPLAYLRGTRERRRLAASAEPGPLPPAQPPTDGR